MKEPLTPHPSALIESMRSIGYRPETALADLVDNSITAKAKNIQVELRPSSANDGGWVRIDDDGCGMDADELWNAMRWGGEGPLAARKSNDLGRFGLGLKTASFSMGRRLTVISTKNKTTTVFRWDLDHINKTGEWELLEGVDSNDQDHLALGHPRGPRISKDGTTVLISNIDRLSVDGHSESRRQANTTNLIRTIQNHLGLVFHRFLEKKVVRIQFGAAAIAAWNLFAATGNGEDPSWLKSTELLSNGRVKIRTFILPPYKALTTEQHERLGGPNGWNAHQGFLIYRADRLIVPGGWLGFTRPEEHYKLARIAIDLPNDQDGAWELNVIKSKVSPPTIVKGDLERIAAAARKSGMEVYRFHGGKVAPVDDQEEEVANHQAFWKQVSGKHDVRFKINRAHPLVEALVQSVTKKALADAFLHAFERLLPVAAVLQQPARSMHGLALDPSEHELDQIATALKHAVDVLMKTGFAREKAIDIALKCQPFSLYQEELRAHLSK
jgi:hypothetical protein